MSTIETLNEIVRKIKTEGPIVGVIHYVMKDSGDKSINEITAIYYANEGYCLHDEIFSIMNNNSDDFFSLSVLLGSIPLFSISLSEKLYTINNELKSLTEEDGFLYSIIFRPIEKIAESLYETDGMFCLNETIRKISSENKYKIIEVN